MNGARSLRSGQSMQVVLKPQSRYRVTMHG